MQDQDPGMKTLAAKSPGIIVAGAMSQRSNAPAAFEFFSEISLHCRVSGGF